MNRGKKVEATYYNQVIPSQPTANIELNTKSSTALTICAADVLSEPKIASNIMVTD